jgi:hypothetical protein
MMSLNGVSSGFYGPIFTEDNILYTFPSSFTFSGASNGYGAGIHLKKGLSGSLTLTFTGGDRLHSSVVATQVAYVAFSQIGQTGDTQIDPGSLSCSDELDTITIASITPTSTTDLTLKVKLRAPNGTLGAELTAIIPVDSALDSPLWPAGVTFTTPPAGRACNLLWSYTSTPIQNGIADYWMKYIDLSMYTWGDDTPITQSNIPSKWASSFPKFKPEYYAHTFGGTWGSARLIMTPSISDGKYYFDPRNDFRWGYSVPTYANRIALCLDTYHPHFFDHHTANKTTWTLWGYPNKNYNMEERTLLGTFTTANFTRTPVETFKWNQLSWPSGARFTHYLWQPSTYTIPRDGPGGNHFLAHNTCVPVLGM